ncbi:MAG TPA: hypothetical protein VD651_01930 [Nitrosarchaeum sp.]|nr:hypothetical protein [Nitrosarchaeum sp.]
MTEKDGTELFRVRYRFKDETEFITITVTEKQYINLLELPIIATCEIIGKSSKPITKEEKEQFNEKIKVAAQEDSNHTKYLLK